MRELGKFVWSLPDAREAIKNAGEDYFSVSQPGISGRVLVTVYLIEKLFREILKNRNTYVKLWRAERKGAREKKKVREGTWRLETFSSMQRTESF